VFLETTTNNLRRRVAIVGSILIVAPMLVVVIAGWLVLQRIERIASATAVNPNPLQSRTNTDLSQMAQNLVEVCRKYHQASLEALKNGQRILKEIGPIRLDGSHMVVWHARNEITGERKSFEAPLMSAGDISFVSVPDFDQVAPAVDEIAKKSGTVATVFQRLNDRGDMLRVASTLKSEEGLRAIGTFIPGDARVGVSAKVLETVLKGESYTGKEVQGKVTYLTSYVPLKNGWGKVVGILNTSVPEEQIKSQLGLLATSNTTRNDKPQLFILEASGEKVGTAVVMADKSLEGADLSNEKDAEGRPYVRDLCARATQIGAGQTGEYKFQKATRVGGIPRSMTARFAYVPELDWAVGFLQAGMDSQASVPFAQALVWAMWLLFGVSVASTALAIRVWIKFSDDLAPKLNALLDHLRKEAKQISAAAVELSHEAEHALAERSAKSPNPWQHTAQSKIQESLVSDDSAHALRRQTENLLKLVEGIDQTVKVVTEEVGVFETEPEAPAP